MIAEIGDDDVKGRAGPGRTIDNSRQFSDWINQGIWR
jgi:hypothetical protein